MYSYSWRIPCVIGRSSHCPCFSFFSQYVYIQITGFIIHKQVWHDLLEHAFESDVSGIRVVLYTDTGREHSYNVKDGKVYYVGNRTHTCIKYATGRTEDSKWAVEGDMVECEPEDEWIPFDDLYYFEDESTGDFRTTKISISEGVFSNENVNYYMDIYATQEFVSDFGRLMGADDTNGFPISIMVCIGTVLVMVFTSLLFVGYDYYVRKEFSAKNQLLEAKRRFVRFVSHEVRTPLNTVCMGLTLLENDLALALEQSETTGASKANSKSKKLASVQNSSVTDGNIVLKKESVQDWLSLSSQVFQNADTAVGVLSDLLNYDKIQMGTLSLELSLINIWATLEKTVEEFQMAATEKDVSLAIDFSPLMDSSILSSNGSAMDTKSIDVETNLPKAKTLKACDLPTKIQNCVVVADKIRLTQVFRNLISNGLKFSKENSEYFFNDWLCLI